MRKACVVLVSLLIGLCTGFIVSSGVSKALEELQLTLTNSSENNLENIDNIDETELYENSANKTDSLNERSYKIYKKLYRNQLFKSLFPKISVQSVKKSDLRKNLPRTFNEGQKRKKPPVNDFGPQLFFPHLGNEPNQLHPSTRRCNYQSSQVTHSNSTITDVPNPKNIEEKLTLTSILPKQNEKIDGKYFKPQKKTNDTGAVAEIEHLKFHQKDSITEFAINSPIPKNNVQIKSHTERKPKKHQNYGFLKPNQLHRSSYDKKRFKAGYTFSPVQIEGPNIDPSLGNMNDDDDEKLVRFIKDTLAESGLYHKDSPRNINCESCDEGVRNTEEDKPKLLSKQDEISDIIENTVLEDNEYLTTETSTSKTNNKKHNIVHGFNINITNDIIS